MKKVRPKNRLSASTRKGTAIIFLSLFPLLRASRSLLLLLLAAVAAAAAFSFTSGSTLLSPSLSTLPRA